MNGKRLALLALLVATLLVPGLAGAQDQTVNKAEEPVQNDAQSIATRAYLGLGVGPMHPALTVHLSQVIGKGRGVMVEHVEEESPAAKAGFQEHDILVRYREQDLYSPEQLVKLVRNDPPGHEIKIDYVRKGTLKTATLKLGEKPVRHAAFRPRLDSLPESSVFQEQRKHAEERERMRQNDPQPWATFKSMTITKMEDGRYRAEIDFRNKDEQILHRDYVGTRNEIRQSIQSDRELPADEKKHLLRSLDQQAPQTLRFELPRRLRDWLDLDREAFFWPNLNF